MDILLIILGTLFTIGWCVFGYIIAYATMGMYNLNWKQHIVIGIFGGPVVWLIHFINLFVWIFEDVLGDKE